ncbi:hypothetical protein V3W47_08675 [Deinococcus sp. YIM 134068]|uniref:hypothetical protein n=1 Tax=Deinococcus lichenicola TaxID=3118910 RepID=UPI002F931078
MPGRAGADGPRHSGLSGGPPMIRRDHGRSVLLARPSALPTSWQDALDGLRPDRWPSGEEVPLNLEEIVRAAEARVTVPRGWDALLARSRREPLAVTAARWQRSPDRVRQIEGRAWQQLRAHTRHQAWRAELWALAARPRVVQVRPDIEHAWALLVEGTRALDQPEVRTVRLAPGLWALYRGAAPSRLRSVTLPAGRVLTAGEAAAVLGLDEALLAVVWPATRVWRTRNGDYAGHTVAWTSGEWLAALAEVLTRAGQTAWEEDLLFRAYRTLPDAPEVEESSLKAALRRSRRFARTEVPRVWRFRTQPWADPDDVIPLERPEVHA